MVYSVCRNPRSSTYHFLDLALYSAAWTSSLGSAKSSFTALRICIGSSLRHDAVPDHPLFQLPLLSSVEHVPVRPVVSMRRRGKSKSSKVHLFRPYPPTAFLHLGFAPLRLYFRRSTRRTFCKRCLSKLWAGKSYPMYDTGSLHTAFRHSISQSRYPPSKRPYARSRSLSSLNLHRSV